MASIQYLLHEVKQKQRLEALVFYTHTHTHKKKEYVSQETCFELIPMVPPNSITHTSAGPSLLSTGIIATRSIHSWIASVMCGTT